jgi:HK97 family phage prohead protease
MVGSVGCFAVHVDQSKADAAEGLRYTYIQAGDWKTDANSHEPLSSHARNDLQNEVSRIRGLFAGRVARNRKVSAQAVLATEAGVSYGPGAVPLFADRVATPAEATQMLRAALPALPAYSIPAPSAPAPAARQPKLLGAPALHLSGVLGADAAAWLRDRSNLRPDAALTGVVAKLQAERASMVAQYGQTVEARIVAFPRGRAAAPSSTSRRISMLVCPYSDDALSIDLGGFRERYERGCFSRGLAGDCRAMFNHNEDHILGRKGAGTMDAWEESDGLHAWADAPGTQWASDLLVSIRRGDVSQSSAAFWIVRARWENRNGEKIRVVERAILRDASVVSIAAYTSTTATVDAPGDDPNELEAETLSLLRLR